MKNRVGLGTFPLSSVFNKISVSDAEKLVQEFIGLGGYYFDTAPMYGNGEIEKLLGRALKGIPRDNYYLGTKTVEYVDDQGNVFKSGKYADVIKQIDNSLSRLNTDYVDLLMVHSPDPDTPIEETLSAMEEVQKQGKAKELAVSNVNLGELKRYNSTGKIKYVENSFSLINRSLSSEFEKYLLDNGINLIPYHLLEIGQLTDLALKEVKLNDGDLRTKVTYWNQDNQDSVFAWVREQLAPIAAKNNITITQLNLAWALAQKYIDFVIVGTTKEKYLKMNLEADDIVLSDQTIEEVNQARVSFEKLIKTKYNQSVREFRGLNEKFY